jgi:ribosomal protein L15
MRHGGTWRKGFLNDGETQRGKRQRAHTEKGQAVLHHLFLKQGVGRGAQLKKNELDELKKNELDQLKKNELDQLKKKNSSSPFLCFRLLSDSAC